MPQGLRGFGHPAANTCPLRVISGGKVLRAVGGQRSPSSARWRADRRRQVRDNYVPSAHEKHSLPPPPLPPPFICCPPLFGSRFLPRGAGVSREDSRVAPPPGHWSLQHQRLRALRHRPAKACSPPRAAVSGFCHQAPPWLPLPLREPRGGTASFPCWRAGTEHSAATPGGSLSLCKRTWPCPLLAPEVSGHPGLSQACAPAGCSQPHLPSLGTSPACWTLESIPGCPPEVVAKPRRLAPSLPPSSIHLSGSRAQSSASPWDQALVQ